MAVLVRSEIEAVLSRFLSGAMSPQDFEVWIIGALDDPLMADEQDALWDIRLLLTEYGESLRPLDDALAQARAMLSEVTTPNRTDSESETTEDRVPSAA